MRLPPAPEPERPTIGDNLGQLLRRQLPFTDDMMLPVQITVPVNVQVIDRARRSIFRRGSPENRVGLFEGDSSSQTNLPERASAAPAGSGSPARPSPRSAA